MKTFSRLEFSIGDKSYEIEAFLNIRGKSDPTIGFKLKIGDEEISKNTLQMKSMIEDEIIGCPFDLFKSSIVISQSSYQNFYSMTKAQKVSYIENLFKLEVFSELLKMVRQDIRQDTLEYNSTNMTRGNLIEQLQELTFKSNKFEEDSKNRSDKILSAIQLKESGISVLENDLKKLGDNFDTVEDEKTLIDLKEKLFSSDSYIKKLNQALYALRMKRDSLSKMVSEHKVVLDLLCEECFSKANSVLNITDTNSEIKDSEDKIVLVEKGIKDKKSEYDGLKSKAEEIASRIDLIKEAKHKKELIENQIEYLKKDIESLKKDDSNIDRENPFTDLISKNKEKLDEYDGILSSKSASIKLKKFIEFTFGDSGAKKAMLNDIADNINILIKHYLTRLGANYTVILDSSFTPKFITSDGEAEFESFSSGEKQRINLSTMLTFRDLVIGNRISSNIFILDEVIDGALDNSGLISITESIAEMAKKSSIKIMMVSHNPVVEHKLKSVEGISTITAIKRDGKTKYEVELF